MKNIVVKPGSLLREFLPLVQKLRQMAWKFHDRTGKRLVINGGQVRFMDAELEFPRNVALNYTTPLFWHGSEAYEPATSRTIALLAGRSTLFLDVGSNIGIYAVYVGVQFPQVKVIAFEPVPAICEKNRAFHRANRLSDSVTVNLALNDRDGPQKIYIPSYDTNVDDEETATLNANSWQAHAEKIETMDIQCLTLDTFATQNQLPAGLCCLKIDVEGCEAAVLRGGKKFLAERRPWVVCEILPREDFDAATKMLRNNNRETLQLIEELNYVPFAITGDGFFRMSAADFTRPRNLKDFLLAPKEKVSDDTFYLALENLGEIYSA